jgi:hypothetical protein
MASKSSLCADVEAEVLSTGPWQDRIGSEALDELKALRDRFRSGLLGTKPHMIARITIEACKARGWSMPSEKVLAEWLRRND